MRILHLSNHIRNSGNGIVNVLVDLATAQRQAGCTVAVASSGGEFEDFSVERRTIGSSRSLSPLSMCLAKARTGVK
jgi:hypothetical protein